MLVSTEAGQLGLMAMGGVEGAGGKVTLDTGRSWLEGPAQLSIPDCIGYPKQKARGQSGSTGHCFPAALSWLL